MRRAAVAVLAAAVVLSGCGSDGPAMSAAAAARLGPQVEAIRQAATAGDRAVAELRLAELRRTVGELQAAGELADGTASRILARAAAVESGLTRLPTTTTTTTATTQPPPSPDDVEDDEPEKEEKERDREGDKKDKEEDD